MARELAECGTFSAYKRHKRNGEPVDDACAQAARDQVNERNAQKAAAVSALIRSNLMVLRAASSDDPGPIDELAEARENLLMVKAVMRTALPTGVAALSRQCMDLVQLIRRLERQNAPEVSALDQLAQRRAERLAAANHVRSVLMTDS